MDSMDYLFLGVLIFIAVMIALLLFAYLKRESAPIHLHQYNQHAGIGSIKVMGFGGDKIKDLAQVTNPPKIIFVPFFNLDDEMRPILNAIKEKPDRVFRLVLFAEFDNEKGG